MGLVDRIIDNAERGFGENLDYLRAVARSSGAAFWKFAVWQVKICTPRSRAQLGGEFQDAYDFGFAVSANDETRIEDLRPVMISRYGEKALTDLAIGIATSRVYPGIKRTLGFAQSCTLRTTREMPEATASRS